MRLRVGTVFHGGDPRPLFQRLGLLEVEAERGRRPRPSVLDGWRRAAPAGFCFVVRAPVATVDLGAEALRDVRAASAALGAEVVLLQTPSAVTPARRNQDALARAFAALRELAPRVAWEPRGVWEPEAARRFADASGVLLVGDALQSAPGGGRVVMTRVRALGAQRLGFEALERLAEHLLPAEVALVVLEGSGALPAAQRLAQVVRDAAGGDDEDGTEPVERNEEDEGGEAEDDAVEDALDDDRLAARGGGRAR